MLTTGRTLWNKIMIPIFILILICPFTVSTAAEISPLNYPVPIYRIPVPENTQREIWKLCEENNLSYELVLAIFQVEGKHYPQIDYVKTEIQKLVALRDYWARQGFADELVFELMLLSKQEGIEGCQTFLKNSSSCDLDSYLQSGNYVQKVTEYKYYLEQIDSAD